MEGYLNLLNKMAEDKIFFHFLSFQRFHQYGIVNNLIFKVFLPIIIIIIIIIIRLHRQKITSLEDGAGMVILCHPFKI